MSGALDDYLRRLDYELRKRGLVDGRILDEAREHLVDTVADGRDRGLSVEDAEREAFERFGLPDIVAARFAEEREGVMYRFALALDTLWERKWWILAPTVLTAILTSVISNYLLPTRYRSEATVLVVRARVPPDYARSIEQATAERVESLRQQILSRTRLERLIEEFDLYALERDNVPLEEVVLQMRDDIGVEYFRSGPAQGDGLGTVRVSFVTSDPHKAKQITERLAQQLMVENLQDREVLADATHQFIASQTEDVRRRLVEYEKELEALRRQNTGRPLSQADLLPYEVLQERYKTLLVKKEEAMTAINLERRQIGEQFKVIDGAKVPDRPVGPNRLAVNAAGTFAGLSLGLGLLAIRRRSASDIPTNP
jgi:uncharacterized protein involved in exopolysaccharide biosynthesis